MAKDMKNYNQRVIIAKSTHCTSFGVSRQLPLNNILRKPKALINALKDPLLASSTEESICRSYIKLINNLSKMNSIEPNYYLILFKILLYMEQYEYDLIIAKYNLTNYKLEKSSKNFVVNVPNLNEDDPVFAVGDRVKFHVKNTKKNYYGKIVDIEGKLVHVSLLHNDNEGCIINQYVDVIFSPIQWPILCFHYILHVMSKNNLVNSIYPKINKNPCILETSNLEWINPNIAENPEQKIAINNILNCSAYPAPYILFGPPGTGKTTTLVETICQIRKCYKTKSILVCTSSNTAADEIARRLLDVLPSKDVFRMYAPSNNWATVDPKIGVSSNFINNLVVYLPIEILSLKKIVITTLVTCVRLMTLRLWEDHFSYIFIDEASQCIEMEALIPFVLASSRHEKDKGMLHAQIVISGDPYQLGPVVRCKKIEHLLGKSIIERLMECEPYQKIDDKYDSRYITKLIRNHRSRESIIHVSNKLFYNDELLCCNYLNTNAVTISWSSMYINMFPVTFFEVEGKEVHTPNQSVYNKCEIEAIVRCTKKLINAKIDSRNITQDDIGIITPFRQQKVMIMKRLEEYRLNNITVGTIETFQGQEREIILLTTVRSQIFKHNNTKHIGLLSNPKRFNVALTRARNVLFIIGNPRILCTDEHWKILYEYCKENNACTTVSKLSESE